MNFGKLSIVMLTIAQLLPATAFAYDTTWFKTDYWSGEYPPGFTLTQKVETMIRAEHNPNAARSVACVMDKGATYHPWNLDRVNSSNLKFLSFVPIEIYTIIASQTMTLQIDQTDGDEIITFTKGDEWTYLTYYAEGLFKMNYKGTDYTADQDLIEISQEKNGISNDRNTDNWMKLTCANNASGWLLLRDVRDLPPFDSPNIIEYGSAKDK